MKLPTTRLVVTIKVPRAPDLNQIYEGELPLADTQQYQLANIIGDGKSEVVVGLDMAAKDFGQGGGVFVSVKLTCAEDYAMIDFAAKVAASIARKHLIEQYDLHRDLLQKRGLVQ